MVAIASVLQEIITFFSSEARRFYGTRPSIWPCAPWNADVENPYRHLARRLRGSGRCFDCLAFHVFVCVSLLGSRKGSRQISMLHIKNVSMLMDSTDPPRQRKLNFIVLCVWKAPLDSVLERGIRLHPTTTQQAAEAVHSTLEEQ